jgi:hypothetical protein
MDAKRGQTRKRFLRGVPHNLIRKHQLAGGGVGGVGGNINAGKRQRRVSAAAVLHLTVPASVEAEAEAFDGPVGDTRALHDGLRVLVLPAPAAAAAAPLAAGVAGAAVVEAGSGDGSSGSGGSSSNSGGGEKGRGRRALRHGVVVNCRYDGTYDVALTLPEVSLCKPPRDGSVVPTARPNALMRAGLRLSLAV